MLAHKTVLTSAKRLPVSAGGRATAGERSIGRILS
jgi:hypothetical protein